MYCGEWGRGREGAAGWVCGGLQHGVCVGISIVCVRGGVSMMRGTETDRQMHYLSISEIRREYFCWIIR